MQTPFYLRAKNKINNLRRWEKQIITNHHTNKLNITRTINFGKTKINFKNLEEKM
jgi:hypothetical protein